jgi:hypothetical protein
MAEGIAVDPAKVIANLRQRHAQQLSDATYENAQLQAAVDTLQAENETLRANNEELGQRLAEVSSDD